MKLALLAIPREGDVPDMGDIMLVAKNIGDLYIQGLFVGGELCIDAKGRIDRKEVEAREILAGRVIQVPNADVVLRGAPDVYQSQFADGEEIGRFLLIIGEGTRGQPATIAEHKKVGGSPDADLIFLEDEGASPRGHSGGWKDDIILLATAEGVFTFVKMEETSQSEPATVRFLEVLLPFQLSLTSLRNVQGKFVCHGFSILDMPIDFIADAR